MAWIEYPDQTRQSASLREILENHRDPEGEVDNILRVHGANPGALEAHLSLYRQLMFRKSGLSRREREMIAVVAASTVGCHY